jgi:putative DNA primase/helicase
MAKKIKRAPSTQITVIAEGKDEWGRRYFRLGMRGEPIPLPPIPVSRFFRQKSELLEELANAGFGLFTSPAQREFSSSVQMWGQKEPTFRVATKIGWNGLTYVLPDKIFNRKPNVYSLLDELNAETIRKYRVSANDSLEDWQRKIGRLCLGNSRLMFAVALAFTGPILQFVRGVRSGGFQIYGDAETGKSTAAMVAGSVWGCHRPSDMGFLETWNTTANTVEVTALAHNDGLLILDETKNAGDTDAEIARAVINVTMRLAEQ